MSADDIADKVAIMAYELGEYLEKNRNTLSLDESLSIAIRGIMNQLNFDIRAEKVQVLGKAVFYGV